ncbi:histidine kinase [Mesorhizobium sp. WSM4303]|uniref:ATP-binding protein n=1 Tax=Mesorhizobium sp. WSM4303 TaxID=2589887 RepID=UPI00115D1501|nr:ATP-binding protein [Mesorhizobium sp. WSM4303]TRD03784.1 histidine kinase [Mesorhizobium sp. WSM4303]
MVQGIAFQTRARTVDHLGREQIADTPTAVSELWKNSFDAYARVVELNIYDSQPTVATLLDDGHGMQLEDFMSRWLVVGTESKASLDEISPGDRNGLPPRLRQGQKGIGRLSCANLGPLLLFVSKRTNEPVVTALLDWRLFENPFLNLSDVIVPVTECSSVHKVLATVPELAELLLTNLGADDERGQRVRHAWKLFDELHEREVKNGNSTRSAEPSALIRASAENLPFQVEHLDRWKVASGESEHGTALLVGEANYDLEAQLHNVPGDSTARATRDRLFETLSSFVDPFVDSTQPELNAVNLDFAYAVRIWRDGKGSLILGTDQQFDRRMVDGLEHKIEGTVDSSGTFRGRVRAFGRPIDDNCVIAPPDDLTFSARADSIVGPFNLYIASMEFTAQNSTHSQSEFLFFSDLAKRYAGFMVFRDGLRVMPYGRPDNDFFEIDSRRSFHAGREFWNHRQMFGRLAISRRRNPNLKDKAGREGIVDNRAAKTLRELVSNILKQSARRYFGSDSEVRKELLPEIRESNAKAKATEARNQLRKSQRAQFRTRLLKNNEQIPAFVNSLQEYARNLTIETEDALTEAQARLEEFRERHNSFRLPGAPKNLGSLEAPYTAFRRSMSAAQSSVQSISEKVDAGLESIVPSSPVAALEKKLVRNAGQLRRRLQAWLKRSQELQRGEFERVRNLADERGIAFETEARPLVLKVTAGTLDYIEAVRAMDALKTRHDQDNEEIFEPYIEALQSLTESIDLHHLAAYGSDEVRDLSVEVERLNGLAQLGIAVEIVGHELQTYESYIGSGLRNLPDEVRRSVAAKDIEFGYQGLADQLRFLSPLRLAGERIQRWITGDEIFSYVEEFFRVSLKSNRITFRCTDGFSNFRLFEDRARILSVFINLVNNSIYWLSTKISGDREIVLSVRGNSVFISDSGPGVPDEDVSSLFSLFFTRKLRGGRGVGLYLSRANLAAGGHRIRYEHQLDGRVLPGANFVIDFRGAEFGDTRKV